MFLGTNRRVSVIAVHGLGANPDYTWKHKITTKEGGKKYVQWLSDPELLPSQIPNARIMTFNYPSRWHRNAPHQRRPSCAIQLLQAVHSDRVSLRPSIIINFIHLMRQSNKKIHRIAQSFLLGIVLGGLSLSK